jgi:predicted amidohydrolase
MKVALWSRVFPLRADWARLGPALAALDVDLAILPELPLNPWSPASPMSLLEDEEPPEGPRHQVLAEAARSARTALLGGAIVSTDGVRHNTALLFDRDGRLLHSYRKVHLPSEEGFWEDRHYQPGNEPPRVVRDLGLPLGIQICSDTNRPVGAHLLAAAGAQALCIPRATEKGTWARWKLVFQAIALTTTCYVLSVNRPRPEFGVPLGGPSLAVGPEGEVLAESEGTITTVTLEPRQVEEARARYPGYLHTYPQLYARGFSGLI